MELLEEFKKLVDSTKPSLENKEQDLPDLYIHFGITSSNQSYSQSDIYDHLLNEISIIIADKDNNQSSKSLNRSRLKKLEKEFIYRYLLYNDSPTEYIKLIKIILSSPNLKNLNFFPFSKIDTWSRIISYAKDYALFSTTYDVNLKDIRQEYPKVYDITTSIKFLIDKGCQVTIEDSEPKVNSGLESVNEKLEHQIKKYGGLTLAKTIFDYLVQSNIYSPQLHRYLIARDTTFLSSEYKPKTPFGYILNKSIKYPYERDKNLKDHKIIFSDIIDTATHLTIALYGAETYSTWAYHFQSGETIIDFISEVALWDSIYTIPQCRFDIVFKLNEKIFEWISENDFFEKCSFTLKEYQEVSSAILMNPTVLTGPDIVYHSKIKKQLPNIHEEKILNILNFLSHSDNDQNKQYGLPSDNTSINFFLKPLIKLGGTKFLLMDKSWCSPAFYEALASALRKIPEFESKMGYAIEDSIHKFLEDKNIISNSGEYLKDGKKGECDFVIETEKTIILIELKKKVLTRKSKSGDPNYILIDLANTLLASHIQASRTEILLRKFGSLDLINRNGDSYTLKWEGRQFEKIALTHLEFGALHDNTIIEQILTALITHTYITNETDKSIQNKFNELFEKQKIWADQLKSLQDLEGDIYKRNPFINCFFMSVPQLYHIIENATNNREFENVLSKTKYVTIGTCDFYKEFLYQYVMQPK